MEMVVVEKQDGDIRDVGWRILQFLDNHNGVEASWKLWKRYVQGNNKNGRMRQT